MVNGSRQRAERMLVVMLAAGALAVSGCGQPPVAPSVSESDNPASPIGTPRLTSRVESEHFVFHLEPGDTVEVERSEAYHRWAVAYLNVTPPKKIDFYKFRTAEDLAASVGTAVGGTARPLEFAVYTFYTWHNHECFHLYSWLLGNPPMLFFEGFTVAHEFDPHNNDWVARRNRGTLSEPYIDMVRRWRAEGTLYDLEPLLSSEVYASTSQTDGGRAYRQAGMFVAFLIERYGLEKMKDVFRQMNRNDSIDTVRSKFGAIFGTSPSDAERNWHAYLDALNSGSPKALLEGSADR